MLVYASFLVAVFCLTDGVSGIDQGLKVTLAIFSGLPDPEWHLQPTNPMFQNIKERLDAARKNRLTYKEEDMEATLGYKGFLVGFPQQTELIVGPNTLELQKLLLQTMPEYKRLRNIKDLVKAIEQCKAPVKGRTKREAPVFNAATLTTWNRADRIGLNNCYNYATNQQTNTRALPGRYVGNELQRPFTNDDVQDRAELDGLVTMQDHDEFVPVRNGQFIIPPEYRAAGHWVALLVSESPDELDEFIDSDFHWYRLDADGRWSHKPGRTQVSRVDALKRPIRDPREAFHGMYPKYNFVCFMVTTANTHVN